MVQLIASFYFFIDISHPEAEDFLLALSEMVAHVDLSLTTRLLLRVYIDIGIYKKIKL